MPIARELKVGFIDLFLFIYDTKKENVIGLRPDEVEVPLRSDPDEELARRRATLTLAAGVLYVPYSTPTASWMRHDSGTYKTLSAVVAYSP